MLNTSYLKTCSKEMKLNKVVYALALLLSCNLLFPVFVYADDSALLLGVFPRRNANVTIRMFKPLAEYLSVKTGRKVTIDTAKNFPVFWENVMKGEYDIVHYNQLHYIESNQKLGYQVIAQNEEFGVKKIRGALIVRKDSGINSVKDLKGKTVLFGGGKKAFVSYIVNAVALSNAGLKKSDYITKFAKNPPNATIATFLKQSDAAGIGDAGLKIPILKKKGIDVSELKIVSLSSSLPHLPWAVNKSMSKQDKLLIKKALLSLNDSHEGRNIIKHAGLTGINIAEDKHYEHSREIIKEFNFIK